jgi:hypothetical protein
MRERERERENEREREREREREFRHFDTRSSLELVQSLRFCHYQTHTPSQQTNTYTEKRILRYRDRHEDERDGWRERERVKKTQ